MEPTLSVMHARKAIALLQPAVPIFCSNVEQLTSSICMRLKNSIFSLTRTLFLHWFFLGSFFGAPMVQTRPPMSLSALSRSLSKLRSLAKVLVFSIRHMSRSPLRLSLTVFWNTNLLCNVSNLKTFYQCGCIAFLCNYMSDFFIFVACVDAMSKRTVVLCPSI